MTMITIKNDMDVELVQSMGTDMTIIRAAKVSTKGAGDIGVMTTEAVERFLSFLIKNRHHSPLEHVVFTLRVRAPIFVWREFQRHRLASYSEESARYKVLDPVFYVPADDRPVVQVGKVGEYRFEDDAALNESVQEDLGYGFQVAWDLYEGMINEGVAREVARMVLPVSVYSSAYVTMNLRSLMNFLSLRTKHPDATVPSFPMQEIAMVADQIETILMSRLPVTMRVWHELGRNPA